MNWEINLSSLIVAASVVFSAGGFYWVSKGDTKRLKEDVTDIKTDLKALNKVVMDVALQNQRLDNQGERLTQLEKRIDDRVSAMEKRWDEVRRGEGLITRG